MLRSSCLSRKHLLTAEIITKKECQHPDPEAKAFDLPSMKRNVALTRRNGEFEETIKALTKQVQSEAMAKKKAGAATGKDEIHKKWVKECKHLLT